MGSHGKSMGSQWEVNEMSWEVNGKLMGGPCEVDGKPFVKE